MLYPQREGVPHYGPQDYYISGNVLEGRVTAGQPLGGVRPWRSEPFSAFVYPTPFFDPHVKTQSAIEAWTNVLADVGCNRPALDDHDQRVIRETRTGTFKYRGSKTGLPGLPDSQEDVGGWEDYPEVHRGANWDTDHDGMPDEWEKRAGLNPHDPSDGGADRDSDGYTNLEEYLGWLAGEFPDPGGAPDPGRRRALP